MLGATKPWSAPVKENSTKEHGPVRMRRSRRATSLSEYESAQQHECDGICSRVSVRQN